MYEPGLDRHEWESEWQTLEDDLRTDPAQALPELDRLVARMLAESGYELSDPIAGEESEVVAEYLAAHEILEAAEQGLRGPRRRATSPRPSTATAPSSTISSPLAPPPTPTSALLEAEEA